MSPVLHMFPLVCFMLVNSSEPVQELLQLSIMKLNHQGVVFYYSNVIKLEL